MTNKRLRKVLAKTLVASMIMSMMSFHSFADEAPLTPQPTVTETTVTNEDGTKTTTTIVVSVPETVGSSTIEKTTTESTTVKENADGSTTEISGSSSGTITETSEKTENISSVTVELKEGQQTTASSTPADPVVGGEDPKNGDDDHNYNQTVTTETPREVTANMGESSVASGTGENVETQKEIGLNPVQPVWHNGKEDTSNYNSPKTPDYNNKPNGYDLYFSNYGEDSHYGVKSTQTPEATEENPNPNPIYDQEDVIQFELTDTNDNTVHTAYCVDLSTSTQSGWWYKIENLEDAGYYPNEDAENHIRAIVNNGYWGTEEGTKGSLQYIKDSLNAVLDQDPNALGGLTKDDINKLTEGEAQTATQMAIWTYGNQINGQLSLQASNFNGGDKASADNATEDELKAWNRINKIMNYWITLTETNDDATDVITEDKFIKDMSLTVGDKVENHANNADDNNDNDAYNVDLTFSLIVQPSADNDDLIVKVLDSQGNTVKVARLAGDDSTTNYGTIAPDANGNYTLTNLELVEGNDIEFNLKLEGAQYLKEGVYIYTSQVVNETSSQTFVGIAEGYQAVDVNMKVNLNFDVKEGTIVKETSWERTWKNNSTPSDPTPSNPTPNDPTPNTPTVITETETPEPVVVIEDTDVPLAVAGAYSIPDEEIPLAVLPMTGDASVIWLFLSMISGFGLAGLTIVDKRKKN